MGRNGEAEPGSSLTVRIWYVFSRFPASTETFAGTDVRILRELGATVRALNLRFNRRSSPGLLRQWGLAGLDVDRVTIRGLLRGCWTMLIRPRLLAWLCGVILMDNWRRALQVLKSFLGLPRVFELHARLACDPPDVLHLFWGHYSSLLGLLAHRTHPNVVVTLFLGAYDLRTGYASSVRLARVGDGVFTHAVANRTLLTELGVPAEAIHVSYRGVDLRLFPVRDTDTGRRLATVGKLCAEKGMTEVLKVFAAVRREVPEAELAMVGDGPQRRELQRMTCSAGLTGVRFAGHLPHGEVLEQLSRTDVLVFLSRKASECLPNVVKEAMAAGCACVVSRTWGIEELVTHGETGFVVEPTDVAGAARYVIMLLRDPTLRERMAKNARAHIERHFDVRRSMARYLAAWQRAASSTTAPLGCASAVSGVRHARPAISEEVAG